MFRANRKKRGNTVKKRWKTALAVTGAALMLTNLHPPAAVKAEMFHMAYVYFGSKDSIIAEVANTRGMLDVVSPPYFDVDAGGSLKLSGLFSASVVSELKAMGVKVVPFLSNHWNRELGQKALDNRAALAEELAYVIMEYNLDGVNVDIENVPETYREEYVDFIRLLREKLPEGKEVSVAVAANPQQWDKGWHGSYDYQALAQYADYLMLMAYDESYPAGPEGPVASLSWADQSIRYALQFVPPDKLVLGLPFYGRYWLQGTDDPAHQGMGVSIRKINEMIGIYDGTVTFDEETGSPMAVIVIEPGDPETKVAGVTLPAGTYHVYYENNESLRRKVELAQQYGLKGTGSWSLGQEDDSFWLELGQWVGDGNHALPGENQGGNEGGHQSGNEGDGQTADGGSQDDGSQSALPFRDVPADYWAYGSIASVHKLGWMNGKPNSRFAPQATLKRSEAAAVLVRMLGLKAEDPEEDLPFADVPSNHWAYDEIQAAYRHGLLIGTGGRAFSPDAPVTREQMAVILDRVMMDEYAVLAAASDSAGDSGASASDAAASTAGGQPAFTDIASGRWSSPSISRAAALGVIQGYTNGQFRPERPLARAEAAAMLLRASFYVSGDGNDNLVKYGMQGEEVAALQTVLARLGYFQHKVTGYFGDITLAAVQKFQQDHNLPVDGMVGPRTTGKLVESLTL